MRGVGAFSTLFQNVLKSRSDIAEEEVGTCIEQFSPSQGTQYCSFCEEALTTIYQLTLLMRSD
jgi:hypothetical protein